MRRYDERKQLAAHIVGIVAEIYSAEELEGV